MEFSNLSDAISAAHNNDVIAVQAGTYVDAETDAEKNVITASNVTIEGVGGMVHLEQGPQGIINGKALIVAEAGLTLKNFELSGANDGNSDDNLAGVRVDGGNMTLVDDYIHNNQDGVLGGVAGATFTIDHSEIADNGTGSGYTHNIYTGPIAQFTLTNSYVHGAVVGHEVKSRAASTTIENNIIADGATGTASYDIDIPNAGVAVISGNIIEKGPDASNAGIIHYGGETQFAYAQNSLSVTDNTILNDYSGAGLVWNQSNENGLSVTAKVSGNALYGISGTSNDGTGLLSLSGNTTLTTEPSYPTGSPWANAPVIEAPTGPLSLTLTNGGHVVSGGTNRVTITDNFGGNTINSGTSAGISVTENATGTAINTSAGTSNDIDLEGANNTLISAGSDTILMNGIYNALTASGDSTITANNFCSITLNGAETLVANYPSNVTVGAAAKASITATSGYLSVSKATGGQLVMLDTIATSPADATVSGGAATVFADGAGITITSDDATTETVSFAEGHVTTNAGTGTDSFVFTDSEGGGSEVINGFNASTDKLVFNGFTGSAVTSDQVTNGNTLLTLVNGTQITLTGVALPQYTTSPPSTSPVGPPLTYSLTTPGHTVTGGTGVLTVADAAGGNTISGGSGGASISVTGSGDTISTRAGASDTVSIGYDSKLTSAGTDSITVNGSYNTVTTSGKATVKLSFRNDTITGGAGKLTLTDSFGGNTIVGGTGGLSADITAQGSAVTTAAGVANAVTVNGYSTVSSNGTDTIDAKGTYNTITANGTATINVAVGSFDSITLNGAETVNDAGGGIVTVGDAGHATINASNTYLQIDKLAGGTVSVIDSVGTAARATVSGGAASIFAGASGNAITTTDGASTAMTLGAGTNTVASIGNDTITAGSGNASVTMGSDTKSTMTFIGGSGSSTVTARGGALNVTGGSGAMTVQFGTGQASVHLGAGAANMLDFGQSSTGTDTIWNWRAGTDELRLTGVTLVSQTVSGGNLQVVLSDNVHALFVGVTHI